MSFNLQLTRLETVLNFANGRTSPDRDEKAIFPVYGSNGLIGKAHETNSPAKTIVIGRVGSYCGSVHFSDDSCWVTDNAIKATAKGNNDPLFLYYLLKHLNLNNWRSGSGQPLLNQTTLNAIQTQIPTPDEQRIISSIVGSLDDRITLLRETNATLEAIAQALFKSWFVDFDPVRAKMEGRAPAGMDEATAALFPDSFEETELGAVPRGWSMERFSSICDISSGKRPLERSDIPLGTISIPLYGGAGIMGYTSNILFKTRKILTGRVGTLGKVHIAYPPFWASDNVLVVSPSNSENFSFIYHWLLSIDVAALNRGSTQPLLTQKDLGGQQGIIPPSSVLIAFENIVSEIYKKIRENNLHLETISTVRDTLLPRLISGTLCVAE